MVAGAEASYHRIGLRGRPFSPARSPSCPRKPSVLVSGSAIGYYGQRGDEVLDESSANGTDFLSELCMAWEASAQPAADAGIRLVTIRTGIVLARAAACSKRLFLRSSSASAVACRAGSG